MRVRVLTALLLAAGCGTSDPASNGDGSGSAGPGSTAASSAIPASGAPSTSAPASEGGAAAASPSSGGTTGPVPPVAPPPARRCPEEMVLVEPRRGGGAYCVDRYEATLVDRETATPITPYYPPSRDKAKLFFRIATGEKGQGSELEHGVDLPVLPAWEREGLFEPKALSRKGAVPQGYASGEDAERACMNARKRLCSEPEWHGACRGEADQDFPYGPTYQPGKCNVFGPAHPGVLLWNDATTHHTDPRMNLVK